MKKRLLAVALTGVIGLSMLAACRKAEDRSGDENIAADRGEDAEERNTAGSEEEFTLTVSSWNLEDEPLGIIRAYKDSFESVFHEKYPNVTIEYNNTLGENYFDVLKAQFSSGTASDVIQLQATQLSIAAKAGYLMDLSEMSFIEHIDGMPLTIATVDGVVYGAPFDINASGVWYNTKMFEEMNITVPETWDEFLAVCDKLQREGIVPLAGGFLDTWIAQEVIKVFAANEYGTPDFEVDVYNGQKSLDGPELKAAFEKMQTLVDKNYFGKDTLSNGWDVQRKSFEEGKAGMLIHGSYVAGLVNTEMVEQGGMETGFFAMPAERKEDTFLPAVVGSLTAINADTEHPEAAKALLEAMYDPEAQNIRDKDAGLFPAMNNISIDYEEKGNLMLLDIMKNTTNVNQGFYLPQSVLDTLAQDFQKMLSGQRFGEDWLKVASDIYEKDKALISEP